MTQLIRRREDGAAQSSPNMTEAERQTRVDLAACYRLIAHFGLNELTYNHISARIPGGEEEILINPFGLMFDEVCASNLVKVDLAGRVIDDPTGLGINEAGYVIHGAVHAGRPDVICVIHTHTPAGMAVSAQAEGLLPLTQNAMMFYEQIGYHDYEGIAVELEEQRRLVSDLGQHRAMILRNHGLLVAGLSIAEAFNTMYFLENACRAQVSAMAGGRPLNFPSEDAARNAAAIAREHGLAAAERDWPALRRLADRLDPSYQN
ncbi:MAG TPA: class II aldolase/adducin family protein [Phenylobacterium sp.]|uniref:class II aldolase/adducin family protein n=1 Tax=Phenylobacterium sp. TaxID=1871053 RepID=UPI002B483EE3|nr:class II aldolase/adducin family protein [Phenylobacterium sp.]HKR86780.1 class II aldolase/adducin family protein [Phenylobacterium sp.]